MEFDTLEQTNETHRLRTKRRVCSWSSRRLAANGRAKKNRRRLTWKRTWCRSNVLAKSCRRFGSQLASRLRLPGGQTRRLPRESSCGRRRRRYRSRTFQIEPAFLCCVSELLPAKKSLTPTAKNGKVISKMKLSIDPISTI